MAYHLLRKPGKGIRGGLVLISSRAGRKGSGRAPELAALAEILHAASLVHDDILDGATLRRNQSSLHRVWGTHLSVLMGDYLFARLAFVLSTRFDLPVTRILMRAGRDLVDGAIEETSVAFQAEIPERRYLDIIGRKTAALMAASCEAGAVSSGASPRAQIALRKYGQAFGMAFQLMDDALDFSADERELGKPVGSDILEGKFTLPVISLRDMLEGGERTAFVRLLARESLSNGGAVKVIGMVRNRGGLEATFDRARSWIDAAKRSLAGLPPCVREPLAGLAEYALLRRK